MFKGCLGLVVAALAIVGAFALLNADPALPDQAARVWNSVSGELAHATATPAPAPMIAPLPLATAPGATPPSPPAPASTGIVVSVTEPWSIFDCAYAVDTLTEDSQLDASAFSRGLGDPADPYYYARMAAQWHSDAGDARMQCGHPLGTLTGDQVTYPPLQFAAAILTHVGDMQAFPQNAAWDRQWVAAYRHLEALWAVLNG